MSPAQGATEFAREFGLYREQPRVWAGLYWLQWWSWLGQASPIANDGACSVPWGRDVLMVSNPLLGDCPRGGGIVPFRCSGDGRATLCYCLDTTGGWCALAGCLGVSPALRGWKAHRLVTLRASGLRRWRASSWLAIRSGGKLGVCVSPMYVCLTWNGYQCQRAVSGQGQIGRSAS